LVELVWIKKKGMQKKTKPHSWEGVSWQKTNAAFQRRGKEKKILIAKTNLEYREGGRPKKQMREKMEKNSRGSKHKPGRKISGQN